MGHHPAGLTYLGLEKGVRRQIVSIGVLVGVVAGMPGFAYPQEGAQVESQQSAQPQLEKKGKSEEEWSIVEDGALAAASVVVSAGQMPLRAGTCVATAVVAGFAYLLTVFDTEARQEPGEALKRVCGGPYTTSPDDLRGD